MVAAWSAFGGFILLGLYGWRMMRRSNVEKAVVLQGLAGQRLDLDIHWKVIQWVPVDFIRLQGGNLVIRDRDNEETIIPIEKVRAIRQGDRRWGPW